MITWCSTVNKKVRRGSNWETPTCTIADKTRCGRKKVRAGSTSQPQSFSVTLKMSLSEKIDFLDWFENDLGKGADTFAFPTIDDNSGVEKEYRFVPGSTIKWGNETGKNITAIMEWEEV